MVKVLLKVKVKGRSMPIHPANWKSYGFGEFTRISLHSGETRFLSKLRPLGFFCVYKHHHPVKLVQEINPVKIIITTIKVDSNVTNLLDDGE